MILYIEKRNPFDWGTTTHLRAIKEIFGEDQVFVIDLLNPKPEKRKNYVAYGKYKGPIDRITRSVQGNVVYINNKIIKDICRIIKREQVKLVFSEESDLGNLMKQIKKEDSSVEIICFYHDISADLCAQWRKQFSWKKPYRKYIENTIAIHQERVNQRYTDKNWVFHEADANRFQKFYGYEPDALIPLSTDPPRLKPDDFLKIKGAKARKTILFACSTYYVNHIGFMWFYHNVIDKLQDNFVLKVVGRGAFLLKDKIDNDHVEIIGPVESMEQYYSEADIVITPVFDGGGMKTKDIEAVAYGKCILSTSESLHGIWEKAPITLKNKILFCSDDVEEWVRILNKLLFSNIRTHDQEEYNWFCKNYSYNALLKRFKELFISK